VQFREALRKLHREESGQDLLEYALVLLAVLTAIVAGSSTISTTISNGITTLDGKIQGQVS
jgi:Flp pilus assembly pilin Flp